ncbi:two-component response regulator ORR26-like [Musa acuminata AAA Group]|uniref:two-component response regulator ORR26-like n=1 Tax=Musa acuminata AAA Group TaxID=214697 RepID=UPI0031E3EE8D
MKLWFLGAVQPFKSAAEALLSLRKQKEEIDLVLIEVHVGETGSTSLTSFKLIDHVVKETDVSVITMCADDDHNILCESLRHGACFHFTKPMTPAVIEVMRRKAMRDVSRPGSAEGKGVSASKRNLGLTFYGVVGPRRSIQMADELCYIEISSGDESGKGRTTAGRVQGSCSKEQRMGRLLWDSDLHQRFLTSVELLGKHAVPRKILELMNVDGLTVKQVSSHLQKHRRRQEKAKKRSNLPRELMPKPWQLQSQSTFPRRQGKTKSFLPSRKLPLRPLLPKLPSAIKTQHPSVLLAQMEARIPQPPQQRPMTTGGNKHLALNPIQKNQARRGGHQKIMQCLSLQRMLPNDTCMGTQFPSFASRVIIDWSSSSTHQIPENVVHSSGSNDSTKVLASGVNLEPSGSDRGSSTDLPAVAGLRHDKLQDYFDNSLVIERALRKAFDVSSDGEDSSPPDAYMSLAELVGLDQARGVVEKDVTKDNSCVEEGMLDERSRSPVQEHAPHSMDFSAAPDRFSQRRHEPESCSTMQEAVNKDESIASENSGSFDIQKFNVDEDLTAEIFEEINKAKR